jgi:4-amino-4-deoxy-L-arabinose transferase-like glycosyltransferase
MSSLFCNLSQVKSKCSQWASLLYNSNRLPWIIILIGVALRLGLYLANNSLWLDESRVALNIVNNSFPELLKPLDYKQVTPFGFLIIEKFLVQSFGNNEYILRLFPLIAGIISLFLFYKVAKHSIKKEAVIIALGLFALSGYLIRYSSEVKQYSSDVAVTLLLYTVTIFLLSQGSKIKHVVFFGATGIIAMWISHPSAFVLAGIGVSLFLFCLVKRDWIKLGRLSIVYSIWLLSFATFYFVSSVGDSNVIERMQQGWSVTSNFMPFPPSSASDVRWFIDNFFDIFKNPVGLHFHGIAAFTFIIGCVSMLSKNKLLFFMLLSPIFITLLVSGFHMYPFTGRLLLFIVPSVLLFIAEGTEYIRYKIKHNSAIVGIILIGILFFHPILFTSYSSIIMQIPFKQWTNTENIRPVMRYIKEHKQDGDILYLYYSSRYGFKYYAERYGFNNNKYIVGIKSRGNWENYANDLNKLRGNIRVWLLFSHVWKGKGVDEEKFFLYHLDSIGKRLDHFISDGAAVYLYDLSSN